MATKKTKGSSDSGGWAKAHGVQSYHWFFDDSDTSICGRHMRRGSRDYDPRRRPQDCDLCWNELAAVGITPEIQR